MTNWYCNNCNLWRESWAERPSYKKEEEYRRDIRCWICDKWELIYTDSQKSRYKELVKQRTFIPGCVEEVERFSTWWSNNIATAVVYNNGYYRVFLLVYDSVYSTERPAVFPADYDYSYWGDSSRGRKSHNSSYDAKSEASWLRGELASGCGKYHDNPILLIHPYCDCSRSFETFVTEPYVTKKDSTSYLKPLDIVKTYTAMFGSGFYHVGVYLGKIDGEFKVCHFTRDKNDTTIDNWSYFKEGEVIGYHPIIPFKYYKKIINQIARTVAIRYRRDEYNLGNRNCEHYANIIVYGINYSEQIEKNKELLMTAGQGVERAIGLIYFANNYKGSTIKLINEIGESDRELNNDFLYKITINRPILFASYFLGKEIGDNFIKTSIGEYKEITNKKIENITREIEAKVEIPVKQTCQIM